PVTARLPQSVPKQCSSLPRCETSPLRVVPRHGGCARAASVSSSYDGGCRNPSSLKRLHAKYSLDSSKNKHYVIWCGAFGAFLRNASLLSPKALMAKD